MHAEPTHRARRLAFYVTFGLSSAVVGGCRQEMYDQPRYEPLEASPLFEDRRSARPLVGGTVSQSELWRDSRLYAGRVAGKPAERLPFAVTGELLRRGRERYDIHCSPCHDYVGTGRGMVVRRGFRQPPSFHQPRLRQAPVGHFVIVESEGFGAMYPYAARVSPRDRWAIAAYIRALQLSQDAAVADVPAAAREALQRSRQP